MYHQLVPGKEKSALFSNGCTVRELICGGIEGGRVHCVTPCSNFVNSRLQDVIVSRSIDGELHV